MHDEWRVTLHAMGMPFRVTLEVAVADLGPTHVEIVPVERATAELQAQLDWADGVFSLWRDDSLMSQYNRGEMALDEGSQELLDVLQACEWYRGVTDGAFDARGPHGLDPSGLVKSWAVARAAHVLSGAATAWMVDASGDVLVSGPKADGSPWRVGIADPRVQGDPDGTAALDVVELGPHARALATSGVAQRGAHIWDPATGAAAQHVLQASVIGDSLVDADVWATAIMAGGLDALSLAADAGCEALVVVAERPDGSFDTVASAGWPSVVT
jgi:thiamine biosynthesis lipoprotein